MSYAAETNNWPQNVYYAWVLYGAAAFMNSFYWMQRYYFENDYALAAEYQSGKPSTFTIFGLAETINRIVLTIEWSLTAIAWCLTFLKIDGLYYFFVLWAQILHFIDIIRVIAVNVMKIIGMFTDSQEDYEIEDGLSMDDGAVIAVSMK